MSKEKNNNKSRDSFFLTSTRKLGGVGKKLFFSQKCVFISWRSLINRIFGSFDSIKSQPKGGKNRKQFRLPQFPAIIFLEYHKARSRTFIGTDLYTRNTCFGLLFRPKKECFSHTNTAGKKNAQNTFNILLNTFEFGRKFFAFLFFHFFTFHQQNRALYKESENLREKALKPQAYLCSFWYKNMCKFFVRLHYVIFTIFHRRMLFFRRLHKIILLEFHFFFSSLISQKCVLRCWGASQHEKNSTLSLLLYCVTADDFLLIHIVFLAVC